MLSAEQSQLISRVANLQGDKRLVMLIDPQHLLQGSEMAAVQGMGVQPGAGADTQDLPYAKAA
jgi:purine-binding chemotaxis protein CheW